jgi:hypothetical protein
MIDQYKQEQGYYLDGPLPFEPEAGLNKEQYTTALYEHVTTSVKKNDMPAFIEDELFKHWQHPEYKQMKKLFISISTKCIQMQRKFQKKHNFKHRRVFLLKKE